MREQVKLLDAPVPRVPVRRQRDPEPLSQRRQRTADSNPRRIRMTVSSRLERDESVRHQ